MSKYMDDKAFLSPEVTQQGGHMIIQIVKKPNKIKFLNIDTRYQGDYNLNKLANFTYNLPQRITEVKSIAVRSIEIPMSFYSFSLIFIKKNFIFLIKFLLFLKLNKFLLFMR